MNKIGATDLRNRLHHQHPNLGFDDLMEAHCEPLSRGPDWIPITPKWGPYSTPKHTL
jgi:hypothetical protein